MALDWYSFTATAWLGFTPDEWYSFLAYAQHSWRTNLVDTFIPRAYTDIYSANADAQIFIAGARKIEAFDPNKKKQIYQPKKVNILS